MTSTTTMPKPNTPTPRPARTPAPDRIGVPLFVGIDLHQLADAAVLALRLTSKRGLSIAPLSFVAAGNEPVKSAQAVRLAPDTTFEHCPQLDVLIVVGDALRLAGDRIPDQATVRFIRAQVPGVRALVPVGTGTCVLAAAGCADVSKLIGMEAMTSGYHETGDEPFGTPGIRWPTLR